MGNIYEIIAAIRAVPGKKDKRAILQAGASSEFLREFMKAVYDPRIQYGIKKLPKTVDDFVISRAFNEDDLSDLAKLADGALTGKAAKAMLAGKLNALNGEGRELLSYIIGRDVKAGIAENSVLEVWPDLFYIPPYQRCSGLDEKAKERFAAMPHFYVQTKSDGQFCYAINRFRQDDPRPPARQAMSRAGSLYPEWLARAITGPIPCGYVAMGELLVVRDGKVLDRKTGNGILNSVLSGDGSKFKDTDQVKFLAWDMVTEEEFDAGKSERPYVQRWWDLIDKTGLERISHQAVSSVKEASAIHNSTVARGEEGTVWKDPDMLWRDCQSGDKGMVKVKVVFEAEYRVTNVFEGEGKYKGMLGGFGLASADDLIEFNCGSGFSDKQREDYWAIFQDCPHAFDTAIVAVEGNDIVTSKSKAGKEAVFLPIFIEIRHDKSEADSRDRVWAQFEAAKLGKKL